MDPSEEEFVPEEDAEESPVALQRLRERLKKAVAEKQEYLEGWQRSRADFANLKREEAEHAEQRSAQAKVQLLEELLPTLDTLELSLRHSPSKELELVHKQLLDALKRVGVEKFGAAGDTFDPYRFEALQEVPTNNKKQDHTVESLHRSGYQLGETVVRPAQVSVFTYQQ